MPNLNEVRLMGRLTRDPELRATPSGQNVATLGLAINRKIKSQNDSAWRDEVTYVDVTCWGRLAETVSKYLRKGKPIFIGGRLRLETWDDKQTGQKRSKLSVVAEYIEFLDSAKDGMNTSVPAQSNPTTAPKDDWGASQDYTSDTPYPDQPNDDPPF